MLLKPSTIKHASIYFGVFFCLFFHLALSGCDEKKSTPSWSESTPKQEKTKQTPTPSTRTQPDQSTHYLPPGHEVRFLAYNLRNYLTTRRYTNGKTTISSKPEKEISQLIAIIQSAHPDILGVCEIGQDNDLKDLQHRLKIAGIDLPHTCLTHGSDQDRSLAILSRFPIDSHAAPKNTTYTLNNRPFQISRGILDVTIQLPEKKIRFLGVHFKSKRQVKEASQSLMRRNESILFRAHIDSILTKKPNSLLLAYGDFNDTKRSKAVYTVKGRSHSQTQMHLLELTDSRGETWTHYWKWEDIYSRFDYVFTSKRLTPLINQTKSHILDPTNGYLASDHRPLLILIK